MFVENLRATYPYPLHCLQTSIPLQLLGWFRLIISIYLYPELKTAYWSQTTNQHTMHRTKYQFKDLIFITVAAWCQRKLTNKHILELRFIFRLPEKLFISLFFGPTILRNVSWFDFFFKYLYRNICKITIHSIYSGNKCFNKDTFPAYAIKHMPSRCSNLSNLRLPYGLYLRFVFMSSWNFSRSLFSITGGPTSFFYTLLIR